MVNFLFNDVSMKILTEIDGDTAQKELKHRARTTDTYVTACAKKFEVLGLVEKTWGPRKGRRKTLHGREKEIILTPKGKQLRERLLRISAELWK